jgi:hypothetical protein
MGKIYHANTSHKEVVGVSLINIRIDFKAKNSTRDKEGNFVMKKKMLINQEDITNLNIELPNCGASKIHEGKTEKRIGQMRRHNQRFNTTF